MTHIFCFMLYQSSSLSTVISSVSAKTNGDDSIFFQVVPSFIKYCHKFCMQRQMVMTHIFHLMLHLGSVLLSVVHPCLDGAVHHGQLRNKPCDSKQKWRGNCSMWPT